MTKQQIIEHEPEQAVAPAEPAEITPMAMLDRALTSGATPETLERLMALQERWEANQARKDFDAAMAAAKAEIGPVSKARSVDFTTNKGRTNYQYEDLAGIMAHVQPALSKHGLSVRYNTKSDPNEPISVTCIISHRGGHSEHNTLMAGRDESGNKNSIQAIGSTVTYLQRYTLKAALGLAATVDDDGGSADAGEAISDEQRDELAIKAEEVGADIAAFCKYLGVEALAALPASRFDEAMKALSMKAKTDG